MAKVELSNSGNNEAVMQEVIQKLMYDIKKIAVGLDELVITTTDIKRLQKIDKYLEWLQQKTLKVKEEPTFTAESLPYLRRGHVILTQVGFNIGEEFGGRHYAIVLKNSNQMNKRVLVLPITSQEPKNKQLPIYVPIGRISGMDPTKYHWANICNITTMSKQRVIYPPNMKTVNGRVLSRISSAISNNWARQN